MVSRVYTPSTKKTRDKMVPGGLLASQSGQTDEL